MTYESLPGDDQDPTAYWLELVRQSMTGEVGGMELPVGDEVPVPVPDVERQTMIATDPGFREEEITHIMHHPGGDCTVTTTKRSEDERESTLMTFKLYGPPPAVGETARVYRARGGMPRGLIFLGSEQQGAGAERLQFYQTEQEYADMVAKAEADRQEKIEEEQRSMHGRLDELPPALQDRIDIMLGIQPQANLPQLILQAEQAMSLASHIPNTTSLNLFRSRSWGEQLSILSNFINVEGWTHEQTSELFDLAIFYLETRE